MLDVKTRHLVVNERKTKQKNPFPPYQNGASDNRPGGVVQIVLLVFPK
jgi:hypothetical protein